MLKFGLISEINFEDGTARVAFNDEDFVSAPLKIAVIKTKDMKFFCPFSIDEHVYCVMDENLEYGVIAGAVYDDKNKAEANKDYEINFQFSDGSSINYNRKNSTLKLEVNGGINISANEVNITAVDKIEINSVLTKINGALSVSGVVSMGGMAPLPGESSIPASNVELNVQKLVANNIEVDGVDLKTHKHISSTSGSLTSGPTI